MRYGEAQVGVDWLIQNSNSTYLLIHVHTCTRIFFKNTIFWLEKPQNTFLCFFFVPYSRDARAHFEKSLNEFQLHATVRWKISGEYCALEFICCCCSTGQRYFTLGAPAKLWKLTHAKDAWARAPGMGPLKSFFLVGELFMRSLYMYYCSRAPASTDY